jgi:hypothetical protein
MGKYLLDHTTHKRILEHIENREDNISEEDIKNAIADFGKELVKQGKEKPLHTIPINKGQQHKQKKEDGKAQI